MHIAGIVPIRYADIVLGQHCPHQLRSSVAKCPESGATTSTFGWAMSTSFLKRSSVPKGVTSSGLLVHGHLAVTDADAVDAVGRALVRKAGARYQLVGGREVAQDFEVLRGGPRCPARRGRLPQTCGRAP